MAVSSARAGPEPHYKISPILKKLATTQCKTLFVCLKR
jgi:hypothetical protein